MRKTLICGIGNALIDSEYKVTDGELDELKLSKGCMELNDASNHIHISNSLTETHGVVKMVPGGSVANSLYTLAQFGVDVSFIGKVANDDKGNSFVNLLDSVGMRTYINKSSDGITGECLVLITPDHERTMYTHLGISSDLCESDISQEALKSTSYVLIEGYLVTSDKTKNVAKHCLDIANENNIKKIITLSDPNVISFFRDSMLELLDKKFDIIFCNKQEALNISMTGNIDDSIRFLKQYSHEVIVTSGSDGAYASLGDEMVYERCSEINPVDLTGAGDMFLAAYLFAKSMNRNLSDSIKFANTCSGEIIRQYGAKLNRSNDYKRLYEKL